MRLAILPTRKQAMKNIKTICTNLVAITALTILTSSCGEKVLNAADGAFFNVPNQAQQPGDNNPTALNKIYIYSPASFLTGAIGGRGSADVFCDRNLPMDLVEAGYEAHALLAFNASDDLTSFTTNFSLDEKKPIHAYQSDFLLANDWLDFIDGNIQGTMQAAGVMAGNTIYWTGFDPDGRLSQDNCLGFTSGNGIESGQIGNSSYSDVKWSAFQADSCNGSHPILCLAK